MRASKNVSHLKLPSQFQFGESNMWDVCVTWTRAFWLVSTQQLLLFSDCFMWRPWIGFYLCNFAHRVRSTRTRSHVATLAPLSLRPARSIHKTVDLLPWQPRDGPLRCRHGIRWRVGWTHNPSEPHTFKHGADLTMTTCSVMFWWILSFSPVDKDISQCSLLRFIQADYLKKRASASLTNGTHTHHTLCMCVCVCVCVCVCEGEREREREKETPDFYV